MIRSVNQRFRIQSFLDAGLQMLYVGNSQGHCRTYITSPCHGLGGLGQMSTVDSFGGGEGMCPWKLSLETRVLTVNLCS